MAKRALFLFLVLFLGLNAGLAARTLKVGVVDGLPGFRVENGRLQADSPLPEFIAALEKELRVKLVWSEYPTRRLLNMTEKGELDLIYPVGLSSERDAILKRSIPVYVTHDCAGQVFSDTAIGCLIADCCSKALGGKLPSLECSRTLL